MSDQQKRQRDEQDRLQEGKEEKDHGEKGIDLSLPPPPPRERPPRDDDDTRQPETRAKPSDED